MEAATVETFMTTGVHRDALARKARALWEAAIARSQKSYEAGASFSIGRTYYQRHRSRDGLRTHVHWVSQC